MSYGAYVHASVQERDEQRRAFARRQRDHLEAAFDLVAELFPDCCDEQGEPDPRLVGKLLSRWERSKRKTKGELRAMLQPWHEHFLENTP